MHPDELNALQRTVADDPADLKSVGTDGFRVLGRRNRKPEGLRKGTGREIYTDDLTLPGMLHAKLLRSPFPHARIVTIDALHATQIPGVHAVITGQDMPTAYGIIPWTRDEHVLAVEKVRYVGDSVACVAAVDEDTANAALEAIEVEYEELPYYLDPEEALTDEAEAVPIHQPKREGRKGNVTKHVELEFGPVDELMDAAEVVVEGDYYFHGSTHAPIEPHCAIGNVETDGLLTVWSSTQVPHYLQRELARVLGLDVARIRVVQPAVGGAFGDKSEPFDLEFCVALHSLRTGRPVKLLYTREELLYSQRGRHPMKMWYKVGVSRAGKLKAVDARSLLDGGAYASFGLVTTYYSGQ